MEDLKYNIGVVDLLSPQDVAGVDTNSNILDLSGFEGAIIAVSVGALTGVDADNYLQNSLEESDTTADGDFTAVDAANLHGSFSKIDAASEDVVVQVVGYHGTKRYVRAKLNFTAGGAGISASPVAVLGILGSADSLPVSAPAAITAT